MVSLDARRTAAAGDYRDDALAVKALRLAHKGSVLVTGIAGIGKSCFLRRIAALAGADKSRHYGDDGVPFERPMERPPLTAVEIHDGARAGARSLEERLAAADPRRLLLVDALEVLVEGPAGPSLLEALARYPGPLVMSAIPRVLSKAGMERWRSLVLPPLSAPERRALLREAADPGASTTARYAPLAFDPAWGGHPRVLEQVGAILRDPTAKALERLADAVSERLGGYGAAIAASLTALERETLLAVARGQGIPERLRGTALSLTLHGAVVRRGGGWVVENRVLGQQLAEAR
jgi:hypothetical protein